MQEVPAERDLRGVHEAVRAQTPVHRCGTHELPASLQTDRGVKTGQLDVPPNLWPESVLQLRPVCCRLAVAPAPFGLGQYSVVQSASNLARYFTCRLHRL